MRDALLGGSLGVGGLLAGSKAFQEQEDPGSIFLAGIGGGLGGYAGLLGAKGLAGKYSPQLVEALTKGGQRAKQKLYNYGIANPDRPGSEQALNLVRAMDSVSPTARKLAQGADNPSQPGLARALGAATAVATIPTAALTAGLGGVAAGAIPGALGIPGFVDPESYGSSNSPGARYKQSTVNYM